MKRESKKVKERGRKGKNREARKKRDAKKKSKRKVTEG